MKKVKAYTDIVQSKKLAEFLPLESADMCYEVGEDLDGYITKTIYTTLMHTPYNDNYIPCWSLAALLGIIQKTTPYKMEHFDNKKVQLTCVLGDKPWELIISDFDNEVDACVAMIKKLHELKML